MVVYFDHLDIKAFADMPQVCHMENFLPLLMWQIARPLALESGCWSMYSAGYSAGLTVILKSSHNLTVPSGFGMGTNEVAQLLYFTLLFF